MTNAPINDPDDEPVVVLETAAEVEALSASATVPVDVLTTIMQRSAAALATDTAAQNLLRAASITDPAVIAAFRLGAGGPSLAAGLDSASWALCKDIGLRTKGVGFVLAGPGINVPTIDPRDPTRVVGVIRLTPGQNKHRFATAPAGLACSPDISEASTVVLVDALLIGLRLAQAGATHVAIVETPEVLPPLASWLAGRQIILASKLSGGIAAMRAALGPLGAEARAVIVMADIARSPADSLAALGLDISAVRVPRPLPPITPILLRQLLDFARGRLATGEAADALASVEADIPELVSTYRIGFCPEHFRSSLARDAKRALNGQRLAGTIIVPAFDEQGVVVDFLVVHPHPGGRSGDGLHDEPRGLLAPEITTAHDAIIVTDTFRWLARLVREGHQNVLLLRGPIDAQHNAERIAAAGVTRIELRVRQHIEAFADVLQSAGIEVEVVHCRQRGVTDGDAVDEPTGDVPAPTPVAQGQASLDSEEPPADLVPACPVPAPTEPAEPLVADPVPRAPSEPLVFVEEDRSAEVAIFDVGPIRYAVELRDDGDSRREVVIRAHGQSHRDRFDLAVDAQRLRFAQGASRRVTIPAERICSDVTALLRAVRAREEAAHHAPVVPVAGADRATATTFLESPDLIDRISADLTVMGWVGEDRAKVLLYLTGLSRLLPEPLWGVYRATAGTSPWQGLGVIAALSPPEDCLVYHRLTDSLLTHADQHALRHRLILVDQAETLRPEAALSLRVLHERGGIGWSVAAPRAAPGQTIRPLLGEARGPVAVLAAAAGDLDRRCRDCFLTVTVDDSQEQTAHILSDQGRRYAAVDAARLAGQRATITARHHALQRVLERSPVVIPFVDRIAFPATCLRHREEQRWLLALMAASALLHQRQRTREGATIIADERDFDLAVRLTEGIIGIGGDGLSRSGRLLLQRVFAAKCTTFAVPDLTDLLPDWTPWTFGAAIRELLDLGYLDVARGRGRQRRFEIAARAGVVTRPRGIHLRPVGSPGSSSGKEHRIGGSQDRPDSDATAAASVG